VQVIHGFNESEGFCMVAGDHAVFGESLFYSQNAGDLLAVDSQHLTEKFHEDGTRDFYSIVGTCDNLQQHGVTWFGLSRAVLFTMFGSCNDMEIAGLVQLQFNDDWNVDLVDYFDLYESRKSSTLCARVVNLFYNFFSMLNFNQIEALSHLFEKVSLGDVLMSSVFEDRHINQRSFVMSFVDTMGKVVWIDDKGYLRLSSLKTSKAVEEFVETYGGDVDKYLYILLASCSIYGYMCHYSGGRSTFLDLTLLYGTFNVGVLARVVWFLRERGFMRTHCDKDGCDRLCCVGLDVIQSTHLVVDYYAKSEFWYRVTKDLTSSSILGVLGGCHVFKGDDDFVFDFRGEIHRAVDLCNLYLVCISSKRYSFLIDFFQMNMIYGNRKIDDYTLRTFELSDARRLWYKREIKSFFKNRTLAFKGFRVPKFNNFLLVCGSWSLRRIFSMIGRS